MSVIAVPCGATAVLRPTCQQRRASSWPSTSTNGRSVADLRAGAVEVEEEVALGENRRLGRIDVLGLARGIVGRREVGLPRREGHDAPLVVADGDHEPAAEAVLERAEHQRSAVPRRKEQAALAQGLLGELLPPQQGGEFAAGGVGRADLELVGQLERENGAARSSRRA